MPVAVVTDWLEPSVLRWPDERDGPWEITLTWRENEGDVYCAGLAMRLMDDAAPQPITASLLRAVPVARVVSRARRERWEAEGGAFLQAIEDGVEIRAFNELGVEEEFYISDRERQELKRSVQPWSERRPGRPKELDVRHYRSVAREYSTALAAGRAPLQAVQDRWTVSRPTASRWVASARELGLLPRTERGKARGDVNLLTKPEGNE